MILTINAENFYINFMNICQFFTHIKCPKSKARIILMLDSNIRI